MRCPSCGAANPDAAAWCGQCYDNLAPVATAPQAPAVEQRAPGGELRDGFRRGADGELEWACAVCGEYNPFDVFTCSVCGASFGQRYEQAQEDVAHNWQAAIALSALAPGAGHLAVARYGTGAARMLLFVVWLVGGVLTATAGAGAGLASAPLFVGALILWAGSIVDVVRLRDERPELLGGRTLLWLVVGVLVLSLVGVFAAALRLRQ